MYFEGLIVSFFVVIRFFFSVVCGFKEDIVMKYFFKLLNRLINEGD